MATPPLETIPEETQTPPTPPNSPAPARVTADPPQTKPATEKNPGRVASGKRLAERNRLARAAKKKAGTEAAEPAATPAQPENTNTESSSPSLLTILGIGRLVLTALGVYYQREAIKARFASTPAPEQPAPAPSLIPVRRGIRKMD